MNGVKERMSFRKASQIIREHGMGTEGRDAARHLADRLKELQARRGDLYAQVALSPNVSDLLNY